MWYETNVFYGVILVLSLVMAGILWYRWRHHKYESLDPWWIYFLPAGAVFL
jgi:hypothetical protein